MICQARVIESTKTSSVSNHHSAQRTTILLDSTSSILLFGVCTYTEKGMQTLTSGSEEQTQN